LNVSAAGAISLYEVARQRASSSAWQETTDPL